MARTVLLADDSVTAQNMGRRILIDAGYEVITVNNGSAALKKVHESRPDLIVLDVYMPGYGGLEVCQRLKESEHTAKIPILLTVGKMEPFKPEEAKRVRADGHIVKPFDASELLAALTKLEDKIVPQQAEPPRGRKSKSESKPEKRTKSWQTPVDPTMSFDDSHSEKIAYLEQVKQRHAERVDSREAEMTAVEDETIQAKLAGKKSAHDEPEPGSSSHGPKMPRPMSVYAAEALRELPVVADAAPAAASDEPAYPQTDENAQTASSPVEPAVAQEVQSVEAAETAPASNVESSPSEVSTFAQPDPAVESVPEAVAAEPQPVPAQPEPDAVSEPAEAPKAEEVAVEPPRTVAAISRWVAENVALTAEEAALELEREMHEVHAASASTESREETVAMADSTPVPEAVASPGSEPTETNGATFAAAASSAGSSVVTAVSSPEPAVASEAAAAWENWQHIRDSVMGSQTAVQLSDSVVEAVTSATSESAQETPAGPTEPAAEQAHEAVPASSETEAAPASSEGAENTDSDEAAAISNIVDSVLAELKPKLMKEISKKLKK